MVFCFFGFCVCFFVGCKDISIVFFIGLLFLVDDSVDKFISFFVDKILFVG